MFSIEYRLESMSEILNYVRRSRGERFSNTCMVNRIKYPLAIMIWNCIPEEGPDPIQWRFNTIWPVLYGSKKHLLAIQHQSAVFAHRIYLYARRRTLPFIQSHHELYIILLFIESGSTILPQYFSGLKPDRKLLGISETQDILTRKHFVYKFKRKD